MKKQKGEFVLGVIIISLMFGAFGITAIPSVYYDQNKAENCPEFIEDTTKDQRQVCYAEKMANDVGMTIKPL